MPEQRRRRGRRRRRRGDSGQAEPPRPETRPDSRGEGRKQPPEWRWVTFPVFFAFAIGAMAILLLSLVIPAVVLFYAALFGVVFGLAHFVTRRFVSGGDR